MRTSNCAYHPTPDPRRRRRCSPPARRRRPPRSRPSRPRRRWSLRRRNRRRHPAAVPSSSNRIRFRTRPAPTSSRCRHRSATCGSASSPATRCPTSKVRWSRNGSSGTRRVPTTWRAWSSAAGATSITSSPRSNARKHADGDRAAADGRERVQPGRAVDEPRGGHLAVHSVDRQALRPDAGFLDRLAARRAGGDRQGARLSVEAARRFRRLAAGAGRLQLGRGQRRQGRRAQQGARACRPTTRASRCRRRRATTCPSCRR